jgi:hypothetical protein
MCAVVSLPRMPRTRWIRVSVVVIGAILVTGCVFVAFFGPLLVLWALPAAAPSHGRMALVIPGVPLTVVSIGVAGGTWTRKWHASTTESLGALALLQLISAALALTVGYADIAGFVMFSNLLFAPWWLLGHVIAVATGPEHNPLRGAHR